MKGEIVKVRSDRELDALIAEKVFGFKWYHDHYSTTYEGMGKVKQKMAELGYWHKSGYGCVEGIIGGWTHPYPVVVANLNAYWYIFGDRLWNGQRIFEKTEPKACAIAVLSALGIGVTVITEDHH